MSDNAGMPSDMIDDMPSLDLDKIELPEPGAGLGAGTIIVPDPDTPPLLDSDLIEPPEPDTGLDADPVPLPGNGGEVGHMEPGTVIPTMVGPVAALRLLYRCMNRNLRPSRNLHRSRTAQAITLPSVLKAGR